MFMGLPNFLNPECVLLLLMQNLQIPRYLIYVNSVLQNLFQEVRKPCQHVIVVSFVLRSIFSLFVCLLWFCLFVHFDIDYVGMLLRLQAWKYIILLYIFLHTPLTSKQVQDNFLAQPLSALILHQLRKCMSSLKSLPLSLSIHHVSITLQQQRIYVAVFNDILNTPQGTCKSRMFL